MGKNKFNWKEFVADLYCVAPEVSSKKIAEFINEKDKTINVSWTTIRSLKANLHPSRKG